MAFGDDHVGRPRKVDKIVTEKMIPVLLGGDQQHVMAGATIEQTAAVIGIDDNHRKHTIKPAKVVITIISEGEHAQQFGDFIAANEIVALSFGAIPATPERPHR